MGELFIKSSSCHFLLNLSQMLYISFSNYSQINEERSKELVSSIDVEIVHKNAALEHMASTVNVDKQTDAKELLQLALQTFEIQVNNQKFNISPFPFPFTLSLIIHTYLSMTTIDAYRPTGADI